MYVLQYGLLVSCRTVPCLALIELVEKESHDSMICLVTQSSQLFLIEAKYIIANGIPSLSIRLFVLCRMLYGTKCYVL